MLSSIHPLGERVRSNSWVVTVSAFALGSIVAGAAMGSLAALAGLLVRLPSTPAAVPVAVLAVAALAEWARVPVPTHRRQVNERWIGTYRGWVYGFGFGAQLGAGLATYVVTWAVPASIFVIAWIGDVATGAGVGAVFGLGRVLPVIAAGWVDRPGRLSAFNAGVARLAGPAHVGGTLLLTALAVTAGVQA